MAVTTAMFERGYEGIVGYANDEYDRPFFSPTPMLNMPWTTPLELMLQWNLWA